MDWSLQSSDMDSSGHDDADESESLSEEERLSQRIERERRMKRSRDRKSDRAEKKKLEEKEKGDDEPEDTIPVAPSAVPSFGTAVPARDAAPPAPVAAVPASAVPAVVKTGNAPPPPVPSAGENAEKLQMAVDELRNIINDIPVLDFLKARLCSSIEKGLDSQTLLGFFRISGRMLKEEYEKKREQLKKLENDHEELKKKGDVAKPAYKSPYQWPPTPPPRQEAQPEKPKEEPSDEELFVMRETLKQKEQKIGELVDICDRFKTDFNNLRNRLQNDIAIQVSKATEEMICNLLPVVDNFERAIKASQSSHDAKSLIQGIEMIRAQFDEILRRMGVIPIKAEGEPFDPKIHEAIAIVETNDQPEDTIVEEVYRGYLINKKVIRPSMVKVAKKAAS